MSQIGEEFEEQLVRQWLKRLENRIVGDTFTLLPLEQCLSPADITAEGFLESLRITPAIHKDSPGREPWSLITLNRRILPTGRLTSSEHFIDRGCLILWVTGVEERPLFLSGLTSNFDFFARSGNHSGLSGRARPHLVTRHVAGEEIFHHPDGLGGLLREDDQYTPRYSAIKRIKAISWDTLPENFPKETKPTLEVIAAQPSRLGVFSRLRKLEEDSFADLFAEGDESAFDSVDVIGVTTNRYRSVRELLRSVRKYWGWRVHIHITAQTPSTRKWRKLAQRFDATILHVAKDTGLSKSRNLAVEMTSRPFVVLVDDDFQIDERANLRVALQILRHRGDVTVLGGNLLDVTHWRTPRNRERSQGFAMHLISKDEKIRWLRLEDGPRNREFLNESVYIEKCDIVDNFAVIRRQEVFDRGIRWNERLKIGAEHQDFYLRIAEAEKILIWRTNALKVRNVRVQDSGFRQMRGRADKFFSAFFTDLKISSFEIIGERFRGLAQDGGTLHLPLDGRMATYHRDYWEELR